MKQKKINIKTRNYSLCINVCDIVEICNHRMEYDSAFDVLFLNGDRVVFDCDIYCDLVEWFCRLNDYCLIEEKFSDYLICEYVNTDLIKVRSEDLIKLRRIGLYEKNVNLDVVLINGEKYKICHAELAKKLVAKFCCH